MKRPSGKSHCPINFGLEIFGDPWSLLVVRDIVYFDKHTFNEFLGSEEAIAPSVLAARLDHLVATGILARGKDPADRRRVFYTLTDRGLALIPVMFEIATWSFEHDPDGEVPQAWIDLVTTRKQEMIDLATETVRRGGAVFVGEDSVLVQVGLAAA